MITVDWLNENEFFQNDVDWLEKEKRNDGKEFAKTIGKVDDGEFIQLIYNLDGSLFLETYDDAGNTLDIVELPKKYPTKEELLRLYNTLLP